MGRGGIESQSSKTDVPEGLFLSHQIRRVIPRAGREDDGLVAVQEDPTEGMGVDGAGQDLRPDIFRHIASDSTCI